MIDENTRLEYIRRLKTIQKMRQSLPDQTDPKTMDESFKTQLAFFYSSRFENHILELLEKDLEADEKSHEIQNEIDLTMDMIRENPLESETILKKLVEIRDSIPCSCGTEYDLPEEKLSTCVSKLKDWVIHSEMGGQLDETDPFYPAYEQLIILEEKIDEEESL